MPTIIVYIIILITTSWFLIENIIQYIGRHNMYNIRKVYIIYYS